MISAKTEALVWKPTNKLKDYIREFKKNDYK